MNFNLYLDVLLCKIIMCENNVYLSVIFFHWFVNKQIIFYSHNAIPVLFVQNYPKGFVLIITGLLSGEYQWIGFCFKSSLFVV